MKNIADLNSQNITELQERMIAESINRVGAVDTAFSEFEKTHQHNIRATLNQIYVEYFQFKDSMLEEPYFDEIIHYLINKGISVQDDTTHALMLIKAVFENKPTTHKGQLSKYAKVMHLAQARLVQPEEFLEWLEEQGGIEKISRNQTKVPKDASERSKLQRASLLILQWLEGKDAKPTAVTEIESADWPTAKVDARRYEIAICKIRPHPTQTTKAQLQTYWVLPRTAKNEKDFLTDLAWALIPRLEEFEAMVKEQNLIVFDSEIQGELDYREQKNIAFEQYLYECERQNTKDWISGEGMENAYSKPFRPPKRKK